MSNYLDIELNINGELVQERVSARSNLVDFIRHQLGLTGSHVGCEQGVCGACTLEVDGVMVRGCLMLAVQADGCEISTVEGFSGKPIGRQLQNAFAEHNALQCGYCTAGMLATSIEYVEQGGSSERACIRQHLSGNYCRCTGYQAIVDAVASVIDNLEADTEASDGTSS